MIEIIVVAPLRTETGSGAVDGEHTARLARLIREQFGFVWRLVRRIGLTEVEADSAVQEIFRAAVQRISDVRPGSERSFLVSTTLHFVTRARKSRAPHTELSEAAPALEDLDEQRQARVILGALLEQMPLELRLVFVLYEIEQLTSAEIAVVVGIPPETAASRLAEAQADFATHLESESDLSLSLIAAAREEQAPSDALSRALAAAGVAPASVGARSEAGAISSPGTPSGRAKHRSAAHSPVALAAKWVVLGWAAGLLVLSLLYAVSQAAAPAATPNTTVH